VVLHVLFVKGANQVMLNQMHQGWGICDMRPKCSVDQCYHIGAGYKFQTSCFTFDPMFETIGPDPG